MRSLLDFASMFAADATEEFVRDGFVPVEHTSRVRDSLRERFAAIMESMAVIYALAPHDDPTAVERGVYHSTDDHLICLSSWLPLVRKPIQ